MFKKVHTITQSEAPNRTLARSGCFSLRERNIWNFWFCLIMDRKIDREQATLPLTIKDGCYESCVTIIVVIVHLDWNRSFLKFFWYSYSRIQVQGTKSFRWFWSNVPCTGVPCTWIRVFTCGISIFVLWWRHT